MIRGKIAKMMNGVNVHCFWSNITVQHFCCFRCIMSPL